MHRTVAHLHFAPFFLCTSELNEETVENIKSELERRLAKVDGEGGDEEKNNADIMGRLEGSFNMKAALHPTVDLPRKTISTKSNYGPSEQAFDALRTPKQKVEAWFQTKDSGWGVNR